MNKKVNIYYAGFNHRVGGAYFHVVNLSKGLEELGYSVKVITLDSLPLVVRYLPHLFQKIGNVFNFPFGFLCKQKVIQYFYKVFFKNSSDIEIFEDIYTYWQSDTRSIVVLHALWSDNLQAFDVSEKRRMKLESKESQIMNAIETNIVTVSDPYKDFIVSSLVPVGLKKKIDVVELGVDISKFLPHENDNKSIIFVGSLEARKNIVFLLEIFMQLQTNDSYTLTIVGDGPQKNELIKFVDKNNIENVNFLGRLSYEEVMTELQKHQYYMHTSTKESFSYSLLEAKLSGLTTVAYNGLEVPYEFIDIKVNTFEVNEWVDKVSKFNKQKYDFDKDRFSYQTMTKNTLESIK